MQSVQAINPDVLCLQEVKAAKEAALTALTLFTDYHIYLNVAKNRKGYSGTAILSHKEPIKVTNDIGIEEHDQEGRVITAEYKEHYLVNVYVPNSGRGLTRLEYRQIWDKAFLEYLKKLQEKKPVIICGDLNVAHQPIDLARPKPNYNKVSGYTQVEIDGFTNFNEAGFIDTFRRLHPEEVAYSYWNYMFNARENNVGWRIDYFLISRSMQGAVKSAFILPQYEGSDHCPVGISLTIWPVVTYLI